MIKYPTFAEAVFIHLRLMKLLNETRYGVDHRSLIESALARPQQAAAYENADLIRQAATLYYGLIKTIRGSAVTNELPRQSLTIFFFVTALK